jgi:hypothetical protein
VVWLGTRVGVGPMQNSEKSCILPLTKILGIFHSEFGMPPMLTVNFRQPSHVFTFNVGIDLLF